MNPNENRPKPMAQGDNAPERELKKEFLKLRRWITDLYGHPELGNYDNAKIKKEPHNDE